MSDYVARPYQGSADLPLLIDFAHARGRASAPGYFHPGDFVWQLYLFDATDDVRLWLDGQEVAACAIFEPPLTFQFAVHPGIALPDALTAEMLEWVEGRRAQPGSKDAIPLAYQQLGEDTLSTTVLDSDASRARLLVKGGYARGLPSNTRFARVLTEPLPEVRLPQGACFRPMTDEDAEARAELHRDAWSVWGPSAHSVERYRRLRRAPLYDPELDIVLESDGQLVSYCVCWLDAPNRVGHFEPVGTRPSAARQGFGRAVVREGMRRLRDKEMRIATVSTAIINVPAQALYRSAGFNVVDEEHFYVKADRAVR